MAVQYMITTGPTALVAATAKTMIEVTASANIPPEWIAFDVTFDGVTAGATPVRLDICSYTATGTGTAFTPKRFGQALGVAQSTAKINDTVEPTSPVVISSLYIPPTSGLSYQWPLGRELFHATSTIMGIRLTAPAAVNAIVNLVVEE